MAITAPNKLSKEEIDMKVKEADKYAEADEKKKEKVEILNQADTLVYTAEKSLKELGDKVSKEQKEKVENGVSKVKESLKTDDVSKIKKEVEELTTVMHEISTLMYQQAQQEAQEEQSNNLNNKEAEGTKDEKVVEAEYEDVDEEKK
jgi:molecular chaperone DnaK